MIDMPMRKRSANTERPQIFQYLDYRSFMRDFIEYLRKQSKYTARSFASQVGFKTSSFVNMVMAGKSQVSLDSALRIARGFQLDKEETDFFITLTDFSKAESLDAKQRVYQEILNTRSYKLTHHLAQAERDYFNHWYIAAVLEGLGSCLKAKPREAFLDFFKITDRELKHALDTLESLSLIEPSGRTFRKKVKTLQIKSDVSSLHLRMFYRQMMEQAILSLEKDGPDRRFNLCMTISFDRRHFEAFKSKLEEIALELNSEFNANEKANSIYELAFQFFPLGVNE